MIMTERILRFAASQSTRYTLNLNLHERVYFFTLFTLTLFYMGFWIYVNTWGGRSKRPPWLKARKMIQTWWKGMFWQKLIVPAHYLCIWNWIITIFDLKKSPKINAFFDVYTANKVWTEKNATSSKYEHYEKIIYNFVNASITWANHFDQVSWSYDTNFKFFLYSIFLNRSHFFRITPYL